MNKKMIFIFALATPNLLAETYSLKIKTEKEIIQISEYVAPEQPEAQEPEEAVIRSSCNEILINNESTGNGIYTLNNGSKDYSAFCDMTSEGGGWTLVVNQIESDPVTNWNEGIQGDYNPDNTNSVGFAFNTSEIPSHSQTMFSINKGTSLGYINEGYTTGNISLHTVNFYKNGIAEPHHIHRNTDHFYGAHDPETNNYYDLTGNYYQNPSIPSINSYDWANTFTLNKVGQIGNINESQGFTFSPMHENAQERGFGYVGAIIYLQPNSNSWLIYVR